MKSLEELEAENPLRHKVMSPSIQRKVQRYNNWVKRQQRKMRIYRVSDWKTDRKKPFRNSNVFYATRDSDITDNPEIAAMEAEAGPKIE